MGFHRPPWWKPAPMLVKRHERKTQVSAVTDCTRGHGHPRTANPLFGAGWGTVTGDRAPVVPSAVYVAEDGRVFVALGTPHLHYACGAPSLPGRGQSPGRAGTRRPYQPRHDATLYRGGYGGQAETRRAPVKRWRQGVPCGAAHHGPVPDTRASSSAGCAGRVACRQEEQRCRCTRLLPPSVSEGEADAQRLRQGLWAQPTRRMTVRTPSRVRPLLSLDHPLPAHRSSVVVHG